MLHAHLSLNCEPLVAATCDVNKHFAAAPMSTLLTITHVPGQDLDRVQLTGRLGATDSANAGAELVAILETGSGVMHLDLTELKFVDSSGLSVFVALLKRARAADGELVLWDLDPIVLALFELTRLNEIFDIRRSASGEGLRAAS